MNKKITYQNQEYTILNVQWFNNVGIVTIDNGYEIKSYIKCVKGNDELEDVYDIITFGTHVYPEQLQRIIKYHSQTSNELNDLLKIREDNQC